MNEKINERNIVDKYNIFKGIAIFFVVSIHVLYKFHGYDKPKLLEVFNYVIGFSIPLFMMLGGFFLTPKLESLTTIEHLNIFFKRIVKRILLPYYFFSILLICFRILIKKPISILPLLLIDANTHGLYFVIIYIYSYTFSILSVYCLNFIFKNKKNVLLTVVLPLISLIFFPFSKILIEYFPNSSVAGTLSYISYFIFGFPIFMLCQKISSLKSIDKFKSLFVLCLFCFIYTGCLYYARKIYGHFPIISDHPPSLFRLIYSICFFLFLYIISDEIKIFTLIGKRILLDRFGENSLFIFFVHPYFIYLLPLIFNAFFKNLIHNNMFIFPWLVSSYLITFFSLQLYIILPLRFKNIFSR